MASDPPLADAGTAELEVPGDPENGSAEAHPEVPRAELVKQITEAIRADPELQAEMLAEVYVTSRKIEKLLGTLLEQLFELVRNPKGMMRMIFGRRSKEVTAQMEAAIAQGIEVPGEEPASEGPEEGEPDG